MSNAIIFMILLSYTINAYSCTVIRDYPRRIDSNEFIFIGKVEDYVGPFSYKYLQEESYGLLVRITDTIYLPFNKTDTYEVFKFGLDASCQRIGLSKEYYEKEFPIGSEIRVIGKVPTEYEYEPAYGNIMIESWIFTGSIVRNFTDYGCYSSSRTELDYKKYFKIRDKYLFSNNLISQFNFLEDVKNGQYTSSFEELIYFEVKKDLLRLRKEKDEKIKEKIFSRLIYCYKCLSNIDNIINDYFHDEKIIKKLKKKHKKIKC